MTDPPAKVDPEALRALERAATPAPWTADTIVRGDCVVWGPDGQFVANMQSEPHWMPNADGSRRQVMFDVDRRDAELIAAVRNQLFALLDEREHYGRQVDMLTRCGEYAQEADAGFDSDAVERAAAELDDSGRGGDGLGEVVRSLAHLQVRTARELAQQREIAKSSAFEAARLMPFERTVRGWEKHAATLEAELKEACRQLNDALAYRSPDGSHRYYGTYCRHEDHDQCKRVCKTCAAPCVCPCGHPAPTSADGQLSDHLPTRALTADYDTAAAVAECDPTGHDPIECSCELTAADAYPNGRAVIEVPCSTCNDTGWIHQEGQVGAPGSGCTHGCPDCRVGRKRLAQGDVQESDL